MDECALAKFEGAYLCDPIREFARYFDFNIGLRLFVDS
jgi:hypothetical protein